MFTAMRFAQASLAILFGCVCPSFAEPRADPEDLPRVKPLEPDAALQSFELRPGLTIELVAHEPLVVDPVAIAFDEHHRMYVAEMRGYSERREEALGQVRLLTDSDGDGR